MIIFDENPIRRGKNSLKWDGVREVFKTEKEDIIPMWVADMDFEISDIIRDSIMYSLDIGEFGYLNNTLELRNGFIDYFKKKNNYDITKINIFFTIGVIASIKLCIKELTQKGDKILVNTPAYHSFFDAIKYNDREIVDSKLLNIDNKYYFDFNDIEINFKNGVKYMILCNPHNPTGRAWSREELSTLGKLCIKYKVTVISDDIHSDIIFENSEYTPFFTISKDVAELCITCMSPSKTFNIPGISGATVIINNNILAEKFNRAIKSSSIGLKNIFSVNSMLYAYKYGAEWVKELNKYLNNNYNFLVEFMRKNIKEAIITRSESTYLVWIDFTKLNLNKNELYDLIVNNCNVALSKGEDFGNGYELYMRLNIGCCRENLRVALERLKDGIGGLKSEVRI
ncbi:MAG: PatB family C-S lyase [Clostridium sp.]|uniref:MalY/PatB family protein n=1 Tax=Clostridium sp. TaxID=1506 RepID=UPI0029112883|nr:PatB family C-S lyase [Clostridium sp.]MDU5110799.1 PatB family C-S lyase [Clostridium sp.]